MYLWETHLDAIQDPAERYPENPRPDLIDLFSSPRKFVLEIGCSTGATGSVYKERVPDAIYWGIEPNQHLAKIAAGRIDRVLIGLSDDFVLSDEGIQPQQIDGVVLGDVIEHMYNPWKTLASLKPYLAPNAEIVSSIPNVRNLWLLNEIVSGRFTYEEHGLLDITHIRFFTMPEITEMMRQCGYQIDQMFTRTDDRLINTYQTYKKKLPCPVEYGDVRIKNVKDRADLLALCSLQYYSRAILSS